MKKPSIRFAEGVDLPLDVATQAIAILARKEGGKSYAADVLIEGFDEHHVQTVLICPTGRHFGLRLAADGKGKGLDMVFLGGLRGDLPLAPDSGAVVADAVVDSGRSFMIDVSQFSLGERKRFVTAFSEQLWRRKKAEADPTPLHLLLEEAQVFLPQMVKGDDARMVGILCEIVRLGRNAGIGITLISQRPQSVNKEALTQCELLVVLQVVGVPEKKALKEWIVSAGAEVDLLEELPFLERGQAYIWSPGWLKHFGKHRILKKWTFDSSATPKVGERRADVVLKPLNLDALKVAMADAVKRAEENDPRALRKHIAELERGLIMASHYQNQMTAKPSKVKRVEIPVFDGKTEKSLLRLTEILANTGNAIASLAETITDGVKSARQLCDAAAKDALAPPTPEWLPKVPREAVKSSPAPKRALAAKGMVSDDGEVNLPKGARDMLRILHIYKEQSREELAVRSVLSVSSGTFSTYLSALSTAGYATVAGRIAITKEGVKALGPTMMTSQPPSTAELVERWCSRLSGKAKDMLRHLVTVGSTTWVSREALAEAVSISANSGTFSTYLSALNSNRLVDVDRHQGVKAVEHLF